VGRQRQIDVIQRLFYETEWQPGVVHEDTRNAYRILVMKARGNFGVQRVWVGG
jgi:hypothetical protein